MKYTDRVIKPLGVVFETFKESPDSEQTMEYPIDDLADSHELWQKALGRVNSFKYEGDARMLRAQEAEWIDDDVPNFEDIDELFKRSGTGTHMLEMEFEGDEAGPINYMNKHGVPSQYWVWTHRKTGYKLRRYLNNGGKSFESGRLSKHLQNMKEHQHPVSYARAQYILMLNKCSFEQGLDNDTTVSTLDRKDLVAQQVCYCVFCFALFNSFLHQCLTFSFPFFHCTGKGCPICCRSQCCGLCHAGDNVQAVLPSPTSPARSSTKLAFHAHGAAP